MLSPLATAVTLGGSELFGVAGSGQRLGPGGSGPRAQSPARPHLAQTRRSGTAQSPAVRLNGLLVLSRKLSPARLREVGRGRGAGLAQSPGWPCRQLPAAQSQPNPHSGLAFYLTICFPGSSLLLALGWISQVILSYRASPLWCPLSSIRLGSYLPASA